MIIIMSDKWGDNTCHIEYDDKRNEATITSKHGVTSSYPPNQAYSYGAARWRVTVECINCGYSGEQYPEGGW